MSDKLLNYLNLKKLYKKRKKRNEDKESQQNLLNLTISLKKFIEEYNEDERKRKNNIKTLHPEYHAYYSEMKTLTNIPTVMPAFVGGMPTYNEYDGNNHSDAHDHDTNDLLDINLKVLNERIIKLNSLLEKIYESQILKCKCDNDEYLNRLLQRKKEESKCCGCFTCSKCCRSNCSPQPAKPYVPSKASLPRDSYYSQATMPSNAPSVMSQPRVVNFGSTTILNEIPLRNPAFNLTHSILTHTLNGVNCVLSKLKQVNDLYGNNPSFVDIPNNYPCNISLNGKDCTNLRSVLLDCLKKIDDSCNQHTEYSLPQDNATTNMLMQKINDIQEMTEQCLSKLNRPPKPAPTTVSYTSFANKPIPTPLRNISSYSMHNITTGNEVARTDSFYDKLAKSILSNKQQPYITKTFSNKSQQYSTQYSINNQNSNQISITNKSQQVSIPSTSNGRSSKQHSNQSSLNSTNGMNSEQYSNGTQPNSFTYFDNKSRTYNTPSSSYDTSGQYSNNTTSLQTSNKSDKSKLTNKTTRTIPSTVIRYGDKSSILINSDKLMTQSPSEHTYISQSCSSHSVTPSLLPNFLMKRKCSNCTCRKRQNFCYTQNITKSSRVALRSLFENLDRNHENHPPNILQSIMRYPNLNYGHTFSNYNIVEQHKDNKTDFN